jgi:hypothetical protein
MLEAAQQSVGMRGRAVMLDSASTLKKEMVVAA